MSIVKRLGGSGAAKVRLLFGLCKDFEEKMCKVSAKKQTYLFFCRAAAIFMQKMCKVSAKKQIYLFFCRAAAIFMQKVWKWRWFLTDVGCLGSWGQVMK